KPLTALVASTAKRARSFVVYPSESTTMFRRFDTGPLVRIVVMAAWAGARGPVEMSNSTIRRPGFSSRPREVLPGGRKSCATMLLKSQKVESTAGAGRNRHGELAIVEHGHIGGSRPLNWRREAVSLLQNKSGRAIAPGQSQLMVR